MLHELVSLAHVEKAHLFPEFDLEVYVTIIPHSQVALGAEILIPVYIRCVASR